MSKSSNRHPVETYELRDTRRLWHVPGPTLPPFGCEGCQQSQLCGARTNRDWERWATFIAARPEVTMIAFEFGTGAGAKGRIGWHVEQLALLATRVGRPLALIVRGGSAVLSDLAETFSAVTFIDTAPFVKTLNRQRATVTPEAKLVWAESPTAPGAPLDDLLRDNITACTEFVRRQVT